MQIKTKELRTDNSSQSILFRPLFRRSTWADSFH